jgi:predicted aconitase
VSEDPGALTSSAGSKSAVPIAASTIDDRGDGGIDEGHVNTVRLTEDEKAILDGREGRAKKKALEFIIEYARAVGADRLVEISKAHIFIGAHGYLDIASSQDVDEIIAEMYLNTSDRVVLERLSCFTLTDATPLDPDQWEALGLPQSRASADQRHRSRFRTAGAADGGSCAPYLIGFVPLMGEHYVSTESHALLFMNSVWGARANADSIEASVCAAVCGRTANWGNHVISQRRGTHVVRITSSPRSVHDWDLAGYAIGGMLPPKAVPVIVGDFDRPDAECLKSFFASLATSGSADMCHIVGLTPEAPTMEAALAGNAPLETIDIDDAAVAGALARVTAEGRGQVSYISLGCPHYSLRQIQYAAEWLEGKRVHADVDLHVWTAVPTRESAVRSGFVARIEAAGGQVFTSTCPLVSNAIPDVQAMVFDSMKQARYVSAVTRSAVFVGSVDQCLEAAITGIWTGLPA